ncbi:MAG: PPOX class F420-dependent oxidoreductase [Chloroflexia bacterium]|nr:PPOX class F420-dependent oxidoreductase [Chloroflexia bacterium]
MSQIPTSFMDLIDRAIVASLATTMNDGTPQVTPVWFSFADGLFYVNAATGRIKDRNMRARPYVALMIVDTASAYRYIAVRGPVIDFSGPEIGRAHINELSFRYMGRPIYQGPADEVRVRYTIRPDHLSTMG